MANKAFPTIPGTIEIPSGLNDFKNRQQVVWTASDWTRAQSVSINYGPAAGQTWESDENFEIRSARKHVSTSARLWFQSIC